MDDPRLSEAQALPIGDVAERLGLAGLKRAGREMVGPCPDCGGTDRFGVNLQKGLFQCRRCGIKGDGIALVQAVRRVDFRGALEFLCGSAEGVSEDERQARRVRAEEAKRVADAAAVREREKATQLARATWEGAVPAEGTPVRAYLTRRGIPVPLLRALPICLRFAPALGYTVHRGPSLGWQVIHRGPAMLAAVQGRDGRFVGVHRTWLDLGQPKGKAVITDLETGDRCEAKKMLGSKKGGAIRLRGPKGGRVLVMGEGIETTLSAAVSGRFEGAAFWAGVDLGNISGVQLPAALRPDGTRPRWSGLPDMTDAAAFVPPPGCERLVLIQDGDSDPAMTRAKLLAGARRAMMLRPGLVAQIVHPGKGRDLNDVLMSGAGQ